MDSPFAQANISPEVGTELVQSLGLDAYELQKPDISTKFSEIAAYFSRFEDGPSVARIVSRGAPRVDKLSKVWEYVQLRKSLDEVRQQKADIPHFDMIKDETGEDKVTMLVKKERKLLEEIALYE